MRAPPYRNQTRRRDRHPQPDPSRLAPRPAPDPRLRPADAARRPRRHLGDPAPLGRPRRRAWRGRGHRRLGRAVRPGRCPALPRGHRLAAVLRPRPRLLRAFAIWEGGISIWGAVAGGALGAWLACRRSGIALRDFADAVAPGIALAQAIARWGNWFNQELYGRPTDPALGAGDRPRPPPGRNPPGTYHPTFLYESLWCLGVAVLVIWADRRFRLGRGRAFALYVAAYTAGRAWIE